MNIWRNYIRQRLEVRIDLESQKAGDERRVVESEDGGVSRSQGM